MEWYTSILPVWQKSVSLARSLRSFVLRTTSSKAKWAGEPGLSQQMFFASDDGIRLWPHWWNKVLPVHLCLFTIWCKTDFHFSRKSTTLPPQVAAHHQRWLEIDCIHGNNSSQPFCCALLVNFFTTHFERCQTSYWWFIWGRSLFMKLLMDTCLSVAIRSISTLSPSKLSMQRLNPSFSMALRRRGAHEWTSDRGALKRDEGEWKPIHLFQLSRGDCFLWVSQNGKCSSCLRSPNTPQSWWQTERLKKPITDR